MPILVSGGMPPRPAFGGFLGLRFGFLFLFSSFGICQRPFESLPFLGKGSDRRWYGALPRFPPFPAPFVSVLFVRAILFFLGIRFASVSLSLVRLDLPVFFLTASCFNNYLFILLPIFSAAFWSVRVLIGPLMMRLPFPSGPFPLCLSFFRRPEFRRFTDHCVSFVPLSCLLPPFGTEQSFPFRWPFLVWFISSRSVFLSGFVVVFLALIRRLLHSGISGFGGSFGLFVEGFSSGLFCPEAKQAILFKNLRT